MASNGLREAGFVHLNIDDCWAVDRDPDTFRLIADPKAFPDGIKAVADYVHSKGLKFGIYTDRGPKTCAGRPASAGYEGVDAQTFADCTFATLPRFWGPASLPCIAHELFDRLSTYILTISLTARSKTTRCAVLFRGRRLLEGGLVQR